MEIFSQKTSSRNLGPSVKNFRPPKLGARSPPLLATNGFQNLFREIMFSQYEDHLDQRPRVWQGLLVSTQPPWINSCFSKLSGVIDRHAFQVNDIHNLIGENSCRLSGSSPSNN